MAKAVPTPQQEPFGVHLMIDGYDADGPLMTDAVALRDLLAALPPEMGMHAISAPLVVSVGPNCHKDPGGLSGFVMIAESHISFHTFPGRRFVTIDLYTCQTGLDRQATIDRLLRAFRVTDADVHVQERGLRYPAENIAPDLVASRTL
ncbi:MAG: S-adenosylmethionine decarboxylase [Tabrizicola sp.]|jgi:S-adenosylmethionine decarboxylase|nr:S-adenosylmethionine decarboxylase [Tabrizicola sp.]